MRLDVPFKPLSFAKKAISSSETAFPITQTKVVAEGMAIIALFFALAEGLTEFYTVAGANAQWANGRSLLKIQVGKTLLQQLEKTTLPYSPAEPGC